MGAFFNDFAILHYNNLVKLQMCKNAMCNNYGGNMLHMRSKMAKNTPLGLRIHGTQAIIED